MIIGILMLAGVWLLGIVLVDLTIKIDELQKRYNKLVQYNEKLTKEVKK